MFFDDIIIHFNTLEEHKDHIEAMLEELCANRLYVNDKKSGFFVNEIKDLGHMGIATLMIL